MKSIIELSIRRINYRNEANEVTAPVSNSRWRRQGGLWLVDRLEFHHGGLLFRVIWERPLFKPSPCSRPSMLRHFRWMNTTTGESWGFGRQRNRRKTRNQAARSERRRALRECLASRLDLRQRRDFEFRPRIMPGVVHWGILASRGLSGRGICAEEWVRVSVSAVREEKMAVICCPQFEFMGWLVS